MSPEATYTPSIDDDTPALESLQDAIDYVFADLALLRRALAHRSWAHDQAPPPPDNERLEFLGDAVLGLVVAEHLFDRYPDDEGHLTRARASLVRRENLAVLARSLDLGAWLRLGRGEESSGGREKDSILADAYEALLGAVYRDGGFDAARAFVERTMGAAFTETEGEDLLGRRDVCTRLQERLQQSGQGTPRYRVLKGEGPAHAPTWHLEVRAGDRVLAEGSGGSKQGARRAAAARALEVLDEGGA